MNEVVVKRFCENCRHFDYARKQCMGSGKDVDYSDVCGKWSGLNFVTVKDSNGRSFLTPIPELQNHFIPEGWLDLKWHVVTTINKPRLQASTTWDQLAYAELFALGLPVIMATHDIKRRLTHDGKRKRGSVYVEKLLLPGYLLVGLARNDDDLLDRLLSTKNTCRYVGGVLVDEKCMPIRIGSTCIKRLANELNHGEHRESIMQIRPDNLPKIGQTVGIGDGIYEGMRGTVDELHDKYTGGKRRVSTASVLFQMFGSERVVKIDVDRLQICT